MAKLKKPLHLKMVYLTELGQDTGLMDRQCILLIIKMVRNMAQIQNMIH